MKVIVLVSLIGYVVAGGLTDITNPAINGIANPLLTGFGRAATAAASGTEKTADLLGEAAAAFAHTVGGVGANIEQGIGQTAENFAPAVEGTIENLAHNKGPIGDVVRVFGG